MCSLLSSDVTQIIISFIWCNSDHDVLITLIVIYPVQNAQKPFDLSHVLHLYIFPLESHWPCRPFTTYCLCSIGNYLWVPNIVGIHQFYFISHSLLSFKQTDTSLSSIERFKWGGINLHLNFTNTDFIVIRSIWFSHSLGPSVSQVLALLSYGVVVALSLPRGKLII